MIHKLDTREQAQSLYVARLFNLKGATTSRGFVITSSLARLQLLFFPITPSTRLIRHVCDAHKVRIQEQPREGCVQGVTKNTCKPVHSLLGLAFHPSQPLLAASLHNGSVQLWNYRMGVLVDRFEEHEGDFLRFVVAFRS